MAFSRTRGIGAAIALVIVAGGFLLETFKTMNWRDATATVTAIKISCQMKAVENNIVTKTTYTSTVPCEATEAFKILHPERDWEINKQYLANVNVVRGRQVTTTTMLMSPDGGREPKVGDVVQVIQDPADPSMVRNKANSTTATMVGGLATIFFVLLIALRWVRARARAARASTLVNDGLSPGDAQSAYPALNVSRAQYAASATPQAPLRDAGSRRSFGRRGT